MQETDLQKVIESFLEETKSNRSEVVYRRYADAMQLFMSYLAVNLLDPDNKGEFEKSGPAGTVEALTAKLVRDYTGRFLAQQFSRDTRQVKRNLSALRAFIRYLSDADLLKRETAGELFEIIRSAVFSVMHSNILSTPDNLNEGVQIFRVLSIGEEDVAQLEEVMSGVEFKDVRIMNIKASPEFVEGAVCLMDVRETPKGWRGKCLGIMDAEIDPGIFVAEKNYWEDASAEDEDELEESDLYPDLGDGDLEDPDMDFEDEIFGRLLYKPEDAIEILSVEDRYASRKLIESVYDGIDEVKDELLDWLLDETYRNVPFPGTGESPANAARILSEVGDMRAMNRLLDVLGDADPLGEEAPLALARLGPDVFHHISSRLGREENKSEREVALLWSLGYLAARHPCIREMVLKKLTVHILENGQGVDTALQVLSEVRGAEVLSKLSAAQKAGDLDLEQHGWTLELLESRIMAPGWGEIVAEAFVPLLHLYPTEEDLEEIYDSIDDGLGFDDDDEDLAQLELLEAEMMDSLEEDFEGDVEEDDSDVELNELKEEDRRFGKARPGPKVQEKHDGENDGGKVIPFPPSSREKNKEDKED